MLLVYTHKITPRLNYAFKQICTRILGIPVSFTTTIEDFIAHDSLKMSYAKQSLRNTEFHVKSHELLFQQGLSDVDVNVVDWGNTKAFFTTNERSNLPFDIFAATFYLLSRYEEYLPHVKDEFGRFTATESLAFKNNFLHLPVVDMWAQKFKDALSERFPEFQFPEKHFKVQPVIDVPVAYKFKQKGIMRTIGSTVKDVIRFQFSNIYQRFLVLLGFKKDPYDTFNWIINKQKQYKFKFLAFFLIGKYTTYDKNISINKRQFVSLIKSVADYCKVGMKVSYFALEDNAILKQEKQGIEYVINTKLSATRHSFNKINLPDSYRNLIELDIQEDYTMGYVNKMGFRAGTCTPFLFYDLDHEVQTPLKIVPFQCLDSNLLKIDSYLDKKESIFKLINQVKKVNGTFVFIFKNYTFSSDYEKYDYKQLFDDILSTTNG